MAKEGDPGKARRKPQCQEAKMSKSTPGSAANPYPPQNRPLPHNGLRPSLSVKEGFCSRINTPDQTPFPEVVVEKLDLVFYGDVDRAVLKTLYL